MRETKRIFMIGWIYKYESITSKLAG